MPERRIRKRDQTRARLLEAALDLFARQGYAATTMDSIAEHADVARQTVLNHYPRKEQFVLAWGARRREELTQLDLPDGSARRQLAAVYARLAGINEDERALTAALHQHYVVIAAEREIPDVVLSLIRRGQDTGELRPDLDPVTVARVLTAIYFDSVTRWVLDDTVPLQEGLEKALAVAVIGIAVPAGGE